MSTRKGQPQIGVFGAFWAVTPTCSGCLGPFGPLRLRARGAWGLLGRYAYVIAVLWTFRAVTSGGRLAGLIGWPGWVEAKRT
jgi:hypothetical protein